MLRPVVAACFPVVCTVSSGQNADVPVCSVLREPGQYTGHEVVVTVGYRAGFEWQELVCARCPTTIKIWVGFEPDVKGGRKLGKFTGRFDSLYRVRVRGVLSERGHYGHMNGYAYQFLVREVLAAKRLWEMHPRQPKAPASAEREACPCSL